MPSDVEPAVGRLAGVTLADLAALGQHLAGHAAPDQIPPVRAIVAAEAAAYAERQDQAAAVPVIAAMHALSEHQRAETAATVHRILRKILHRPTVRAKEFSASPEGRIYLDALQQLFDLRMAEAKA
jgi:glutamyl-tRNA reductase